MKGVKHLQEELGARVIDGIFGVQTKFAVEVWHMTKEQAKAKLLELFKQNLALQAENAQLKRKVKKLKRSLVPWCDNCGGPYTDAWLQQYGGHWDTCPNRLNLPLADSSTVD